MLSERAGQKTEKGRSRLSDSPVAGGEPAKWLTEFGLVGPGGRMCQPGEPEGVSRHEAAQFNPSYPEGPGTRSRVARARGLHARPLRMRCSSLAGTRLVGDAAWCFFPRSLSRFVRFFANAR